jgi:hypothetical protein
VDFSSQIRPIISAKCFACHGPDEKARKAKLRLDLREEATKERSDGTFAIKPGDLKQSELIRRITNPDPDEVMPPPKTGKSLNADEIARLKKWIQQGAPYTGHWAFTKPTRPALPRTKNKLWPKNDIDYFICQKLEATGLKPSPAADRYALIRRLSLDLIGLPPSPAEVEQFVQDKSPNAYEKAVDHLLASPAYGEKWARMWLDIARYADSAGYGSDPLRLNIWPYRDWVIKALNRNLPYDEFTIEQIAGDLAEHPTEEQLIATGFHRNTMTNTEGGTDDEEWRVAAVKDRINVTMQAWMGLTMGCAQCHTHKFDPITQKEYYQFYAFFNQTEDDDKPDEHPTLPLPTPEQRGKMSKLNNEIARLEKELESGSAETLAEFAAWEQAQQKVPWSPLEPQEFQSANGTKFTKLEDQSLRAGDASPPQDTYTVSFRSDLNRATALRLEVFSDANFPGNGPGRSTKGNFVLNDFTVTAKRDSSQPVTARFVRIELAGKERILSLAEVQVFSGTNNVALKGKASQSSTDSDGESKRAIDGNTDGDYSKNSTTHTKKEDNPWWEVDLPADTLIDSIVLWNRTDADLGGRLANCRVIAMNAAREAVWATKVRAAPKPDVKLALGEEHELVLKRATASHSQKKYDIADAIDDTPQKKSGWGVAGEPGRAQTAIFEIVGGVPAGSLTVKLVQNFGEQSTIGRFRVSAADFPYPAVFIPTNIASLLNVPMEQRPAEQKAEALKWFTQYAVSNARVREQFDARKAELANIKPVALPVMRELAADKHRVTHLLNKGNFLEPGDEVRPAVPAAFHPWPAGASTNRLGVARWLMHPDNPLTARVAVNRIWSQIFGAGIVETEEDFGTQGTLPSHPELLDWLAVEFMSPVEPVNRYTVESRGGEAREVNASTLQRFNASTNAWDMKRLIKTIVMSATYQQTSRVTPKLLEKDPRNRLLSRAPRRRLDAEMVRDQALALSGLLSHKVGGPSVYPPQPDGIWRAAFNGERTYATSKGEDRYRRGLYTIWRRTVPNPTMATFDAPSRETCTFRRLPTNTPLQAYVTLNDPVFVEAAQALGRRLVREGGETVADRIRFGLRLMLARPANEKDVGELVKLYEAQLAHFKNKEADALELATKPLGPLPDKLTATEAAAWTVVANVLLNLDGVLTKG